jgi:hypothetical protein
MRLCAVRSSPRAKFIPKFLVFGEQLRRRPAMTPGCPKTKGK